MEGRELVIKVQAVVADAVHSDSIDEVIETIKRELGLELSPEEVEEVLEPYSDEELGPGFIGADDLIHLILKKMGFVVFKSGRANIVALPTRVRCKEGWEKDGVEILILSDPDSAIVDHDSIIITGYRFGYSVIKVNDDPYIDIHECFGDPSEVYLRRLKDDLRFLPRYIDETEEEYKERMRIRDEALELLEKFTELYYKARRKDRKKVKKKRLRVRRQS